MELSFRVRAILLLIYFLCFNFRTFAYFTCSHPMNLLYGFLQYSKRIQIALVFQVSLNLLFGILWLWPLPWPALQIYLLVSALVAYFLFKKRLEHRVMGMGFRLQDRSGLLRAKVYRFVKAELKQRGYRLGPSSEGLVLKAERHTPQFYWYGVLLICCGVLPGLVWYRCCGDRFKLMLYDDGLMLKTEMDIVGPQATYDWHRIYFRMLEKNWLFYQATPDPRLPE